MKAPDGDRGCFGNTGANGCNKAFDKWAFTHDSTDYNVYGLIVSENQVGNRHLDLLLSKKIPDALKGLKLCVGTTGYALSDGTISDDEPANDDNAMRWRIASDALNWSAGDKVPVSLASSCTVTFGFENATHLVKENVGSFVLGGAGQLERRGGHDDHDRGARRHLDAVRPGRRARDRLWRRRDAHGDHDGGDEPGRVHAGHPR